MLKTISLLATLIVITFNSCSSKNYANQNSNTINANEIINLLNDGKDIYLENKIINGDLNFNQLKNAYRESNNVHRANITSSITFFKCIFTGKVSAYNAGDGKSNLVSFTKNVSFMQCEFKEEVALREGNFYGTVNFSGSSFLKRVSFEGSNYMTDAFFSKSSFSEEARFQNIVFQNKANFMEAICGKTISFQGTAFFGEAQFSVAKFLAYADFSVASFSSGCFFNYAEFSNQAIFNNTVFKGRVEFLNAAFKANTEFKSCIFYDILKMNEASVDKTLNLQNSTFIFLKPDLTNYKKTDQTKLIFDNAKTTSFQPLTEKDF
jgi:hypothetical protein